MMLLHILVQHVQCCCVVLASLWAWWGGGNTSRTAQASTRRATNLPHTGPGPPPATWHWCLGSEEVWLVLDEHVTTGEVLTEWWAPKNASFCSTF